MRKNWTRNNRPKIGIKTINPAEVSVARRLESEGYEIIKRGWPDLIAVRGDEIRFIEVKRHHGLKLKPHQQQVSEILKRLGITVEILYKHEGL